MADPHAILTALSTAQMQRIGILMHEYDSIRAEVRTQIQVIFQLYTMVVLVLTWLLAILYTGDSEKRKPLSRLFVAVVAVGVVCLVVQTAMTFNGMGLLAARTRQIEAQVDKMVGENILQWETYWGPAANGGPFRLLNPVPPTVPDRYTAQHSRASDSSLSHLSRASGGPRRPLCTYIDAVTPEIGHPNCAQP